uniref:SJCHGC05080 protein n=1 Tax=Schistosoma japonicum TaxID=6182 RepID=Q5DGM1_SCHJA|nr:SJCHGC05080 protein [Schistosoma japonicum]
MGSCFVLLSFYVTHLFLFYVIFFFVYCNIAIRFVHYDSMFIFLLLKDKTIFMPNNSRYIVVLFDRMKCNHFLLLLPLFYFAFFVSSIVFVFIYMLVAYLLVQLSFISACLVNISGYMLT